MTQEYPLRRRRAQEVAMMFAVAVIPRTFQRSLLPRSTVDQGLITSISVALVYMLGLLTQDAVDAAAQNIVGHTRQDSRSSRAALFISLAALGAGILVQRVNTYDAHEKLPRSAARTSGRWVQNAGIAGVIIGAVEILNHSISSDKRKAKERDLLPYFVAAGLLYSLTVEYFVAKKDADFSVKNSLVTAKPARVIGIGAGVTALLVGLVYTERTVAKKVDAALGKSAPRFKPNWLPVGHMVGLGLITSGIYALMHRTYGKLEHSAGILETGFTTPPRSALLSGSAESFVPWSSLSIQGRRHVATQLTPKQITKVMNEPAVEPIRIFVGLDTAADEEQRVAVALQELERTHAFEREYILVVSPTGTGYVNYVMSEAVEYMTRGNVASVTIQYSKRPSPMSLDRVDEGHIQYRLLLNSIRKRLETLPKTKRPQILLFGESLGAWTSQDAVMHEGTDGLRALDVSRALWIGTPKGSKWKEQALSRFQLNTDKELVGIFDNYQQVLNMGKAARSKLRYVMVTHYNDPIAQFGLELLIKQPEWVADETKRPQGMSKTTRYFTPTLFVQTLIDMKNALKPIPGKFVANAHDYRSDLAQFVQFSYGFSVTTEQLTAIEKALRSNEIIREKRIQGN